MDLSNVNDRGNVEDTRGGGGKRKLALGGGALALIVTLVGSWLGLDPNAVKFFQGLAGNVGQNQKADPADAKGIPDGMNEFCEKIIGSSDKIWQEQFQKHHRKDYEKPTMRLFAQNVSTGCGAADSGVGPFYCPADKQVYLDPTFFDELEKRLGGSAADFSKAYVIAHEVGHHVQNLLGYNSRVKDFERREGENAGMRLELQADYLAGVWAHHAEKKYRIIEKGDIEAAFKTAQAIGDDKLQARGGPGRVKPETFNHGKADQRQAFFRAGLETGDASKNALDHFFDERVRPLDLKPSR